MDTVRMLMLTMQLFCLVLSLRQVFVGSTVTCLDKEVNDTLIKLNCTVESLDYGIVFTYPNNRSGQAYCVVPVFLETLCDCSCNSTPECYCNISQDLSTKITSLQIMGTNLTNMFGWYTCAHGSYKKSIMVTRHVLWLDTDVNDEMIKVICTPDELTSRVDFYFPKKIGHAYCKAPRPSSEHFNCSCNAPSASKCNIFQDIATKTTTLEIYYQNLTSMFGRYTCVHGSNHKTTMVSRPSTYRQDNDDACSQKKTEVVYIVVFTMALAVVISVCCFCSGIPGRIKKYIVYCFYVKQHETAFVPFDIKCNTCSLSICEICIDCRKGFCDICCGKHTQFKENVSHKVFQIQHVATSQKAVTCGIRKCKELAERVCRNCWVERCVSCVSKDHICTEYKMMKIIQTPSESTPQAESGQDNLKFIRKISIQDDKCPVRIYGIDYLEDGTLVAIDKNNEKLIVFISDDKQINEELKDEPRGITAMTGNEIAITFPCSKQIKVYAIDLNCKKVRFVKVIIYPDIRFLKPFNIAYSNGYFAVEAGEGEDGIIKILENNKTEEYKIAKEIPCKFAYFTGHSIRLALDIDRDDMNDGPRGRIYLSTMSNKMISCIDLERKVLWKVPMPSPRSIIVVPKEHSYSNNIILSSRRCNAIYALDKKKGIDTILQASDVNSPRYIACHFETNTFCVLVKNGDKKNVHDELVIFKFKSEKKQDDGVNDDESNDNTSLVKTAD